MRVYIIVISLFCIGIIQSQEKKVIEIKQAGSFDKFNSNRKRRDAIDIKDVLKTMKSEVRKMKNKTDIIDVIESNGGEDGFIRA